MPSATWPKSAVIEAKDLPSASFNPTRRLRDKSPVQVSIKSPMPVKPIKVSARPPIATPNRTISAKPRVINPARAFKPKPNPSVIPVAIARIFFTAPPTSTPITSSVEYTRIEPPCTAATTCSRN